MSSVDPTRLADLPSHEWNKALGVQPSPEPCGCSLTGRYECGGHYAQCACDCHLPQPYIGPSPEPVAPTRFHLGGDGVMHEWPTGEWVRFAALASHAPAPTREQIARILFEQYAEPGELFYIEEYKSGVDDILALFHAPASAPSEERMEARDGTTGFTSAHADALNRMRQDYANRYAGGGSFELYVAVEAAEDHIRAALRGASPRPSEDWHELDDDALVDLSTRIEVELDRRGIPSATEGASPVRDPECAFCGIEGVRCPTHDPVREERERAMEAALLEILEHEGHTAMVECLTMIFTTARTALEAARPPERAPPRTLLAKIEQVMDLTDHNPDAAVQDAHDILIEVWTSLLAERGDRSASPLRRERSCGACGATIVIQAERDRNASTGESGESITIVGGIGCGPVDLSHDEVRLAGGARVRWIGGGLDILCPESSDPYPLERIGSASVEMLHRLLARHLFPGATPPEMRPSNPVAGESERETLAARLRNPALEIQRLHESGVRSWIGTPVPQSLLDEAASLIERGESEPGTLQGSEERERRLEQALREVIEHEGHTAIESCMTMMITTARTALGESEPEPPTPKGAVQGQGSAEPTG